MRESTVVRSIVALALVTTVITQVVYLALDAGGQSHIAYPIWRIEALAALTVSILGFALYRLQPLVAGGLVVSGLLNLLQTAMGLMLFYQLGYGGEEPPGQAFFAVLGLSFFLYFAAKVAIGGVAILLGAMLWKRGKLLPRTIGALAALAGLAAVVLNAAAMVVGMDMVFIAGAAGTAATLFAAMSLWAAEPAEA